MYSSLYFVIDGSLSADDAKRGDCTLQLPTARPAANGWNSRSIKYAKERKRRKMRENGAEIAKFVRFCRAGARGDQVCFQKMQTRVCL
jgi:hypothetical protein